MSDAMLTSLGRALEASLSQWQLHGRLAIGPDIITIANAETEISITRAPGDMPFRWVITHLCRKRTAASVSGVLRIVRQALAPGYQPLRLRIAPQPVTLPRDARER